MSQGFNQGNMDLVNMILNAFGNLTPRPRSLNRSSDTSNSRTNLNPNSNSNYSFLFQPRNPTSFLTIPVDIYENEDYIHIHAELPGVLPDDIEIDVYNNKLTIYAKKVCNYTSEAYGVPSTCEIKYGEMKREVILSMAITRQETVQTNFSDGVLYIKIRKFIEEENAFTLHLDSSPN